MAFSSPYHAVFPDRDADLAAQVTVIDWAVGDAPLALNGGVAAAIGNFDGVHRGHQALISAAVNRANGDGLVPAVMTFSPHPRRFFNPGGEGFALADDGDKIAFLAQLGVKTVIRLKFDDAMRSTSAEDFVERILPQLGVKALYAGADFAFGTGRGGGMDMIAERGAAAGITAHAVELVAGDDEVISSSRIRRLISEGRVAEAAPLLGRPYIISGEVIKGDQRGRTIGFPTANMRLHDMMPPKFGVYTIAARLADAPDAPIYGGVANLGVRPTANDRGVLLEANLFEYDGDLYGQRLNILLLDFIRPEMTFESFDKLKDQIARDAGTARVYHRDNQGR